MASLNLTLLGGFEMRTATGEVVEILGQKDVRPTIDISYGHQMRKPTGLPDVSVMKSSLCSISSTSNSVLDLGKSRNRPSGISISR